VSSRLGLKASNHEYRSNLLGADEMEEMRNQRTAELEEKVLTKDTWDAIFENTKQASKDDVEELIKTFTRALGDKMVSRSASVTKSFKSAYDAIDATLSRQLAAIMHSPKFQKLEGRWRGLKYLLDNSEVGVDLKIKVMNCKKSELKEDLANAADFDQSQFFRKIYEDEFGTPGGIPFAAMIGDYEFENHPEDIQMLRKVSQVSAAAFCPFIASTSCKMLGLASWDDLNRPMDIKSIFDQKKYAAWNSFRESDESRFVVLTMPRTLARYPYGSNTERVKEFNYEELPLGKDGESIAVNHDQYCWMSTAFVLGSKLTDSFARTGFCTSIRGAENGGKVENLPVHVVATEEGDEKVKCPTEVLIRDKREKELSDCGFLALSNYKDKDFSVFFGGQTTQKPKSYMGKDGDYATENAKISARLPFIMAVSRFSHYLKVMARDWIGSAMSEGDTQRRLNNWLMCYVSPGDPSPEVKVRKPLKDASIEVKAIPGSPGEYNATLKLQPHLPMEALTASMQLVARLKQGS
jgi:type VI secretion system protein ImpC